MGDSGKRRLSDLPFLRTFGLLGLLTLQLIGIAWLLLHVSMKLSGDMGWRLYDLSLVTGSLAHNHGFELVITLTLMLALACTAIVLRNLLSDQKRTDGLLRVSSGSFIAMVEEYFTEWDLTPAERDVALLAIKGFMIADIAKLRATKEGTIKAHCNAIYRKARVAGRSQLLSLFIEDLISQGMQSPEATSRLLLEKSP